MCSLETLNFLWGKVSETWLWQDFSLAQFYFEFSYDLDIEINSMLINFLVAWSWQIVSILKKWVLYKNGPKIVRMQFIKVLIRNDSTNTKYNTCLGGRLLRFMAELPESCYTINHLIVVYKKDIFLFCAGLLGLS